MIDIQLDLYVLNSHMWCKKIQDNPEKATKHYLNLSNECLKFLFVITPHPMAAHGHIEEGEDKYL